MYILITARWILKMINVSDQNCKKSKHILCSVFRMFRLWDEYGTARQARDDNRIWCMRFAHWIAMATDKHSECAMLLAFARQQRLCGSASLLRLYVKYCLYCYEVWSVPLASQMEEVNVRSCTLRNILTLILLMWRIGWAHNNARK